MTCALVGGAVAKTEFAPRHVAREPLWPRIPRPARYSVDAFIAGIKRDEANTPAPEQPDCKPLRRTSVTTECIPIALVRDELQAFELVALVPEY